MPFARLSPKVNFGTLISDASAMQKLSTHINRHSNSTKHLGFSLLEILVALAIIGLLVGIAIPYLGGSNDRYAKQEINRLVAAIELVKDLAVIQNQEYGLSVHETGYQFLVLDETDENKPAKWQVIAERPELAEHEFIEGVEVNIAIDGENIFKAAEDRIEIFENDVDIFEKEEETLAGELKYQGPLNGSLFNDLERDYSKEF